MGSAFGYRPGDKFVRHFMLSPLWDLDCEVKISQPMSTEVPYEGRSSLWGPTMDHPKNKSLA